MVGEPEQNLLLKAYEAKNSAMISRELHSDKQIQNHIVAHADEIPIYPYCADLVLLPHTLDFGKNPHLILREANICLAPEGHLVIIGFNPYSLWGVRRWVAMRLHMPWRCSFHPSWKIRAWLGVLNYEVVTQKRAIFRPFARRFGLFRKMAFLESFLRLLFPFSGAVYIIVAKKKVFGVTPLRKAKWKRVPEVLSASGVPTPTSSSINREINE